jgi:Leucine-rich repeat (LRR) protein
MTRILVATVFLGVVVLMVYSRDSEDTIENVAIEVPEKSESAEQSGVPSTSDKAVREEPVVRSTEVLDLSGQALSKTPEYVFNETGLQTLDLSNNKLGGSLQAEVRQLQNLKVLDVSDNQFTGVPAEIGQLKNLEMLDLSNNQITGLPHELGNLSSLKVLNVRGNEYSRSDLEIIKKNLPSTTEIITE